MNIPQSAIEPFGFLGIPTLVFDVDWELLLEIDEYVQYIQTTPEFIIMGHKNHIKTMTNMAINRGASDIEFHIKDDKENKQFIYNIGMTIFKKRHDFVIPMPKRLVEY